jgi:hypothetical protein
MIGKGRAVERSKFTGVGSEGVLVDLEEYLQHCQAKDTSVMLHQHQ